MAYTRKYTPRSLKPDRQIVHEPEADDIYADEYNVDQQLNELTKKVIRRLHQEIHNYTVPQLLSGLHKCLQVRVLLVTLTAKGGGDNVGSSVRKYATAFAPQNDSRGRASSRRSGARGRAAAIDDNVVDLITDED